MFWLDQAIESLEKRMARLENPPAVKVVRLNETATLPSYQTQGAAGCDLRSVEAHSLLPGETKIVATGLSIELPHGYEAQVRSRSGLATKGIVVANSPGTIDEDYRGEIKAIVHNASGNHFEIQPGDRIAQLVVARAIQATFVEATELSSTDRGAGGLGSTGVK